MPSFVGSGAVASLTEHDQLQGVSYQVQVVKNTSNTEILTGTAVELDTNPDLDYPYSVRPASDNTEVFAGIAAEIIKPGAYGLVVVSGVIVETSGSSPSEVKAGNVFLSLSQAQPGDKLRVEVAGGFAHLSNHSIAQPNHVGTLLCQRTVGSRTFWYVSIRSHIA